MDVQLVNRAKLLELTISRRFLYLIVALTTAAVPAYAFYGLVGLDNLTLHAIVPVVSAIILSTGYHNFFVSSHRKLSKQYGTTVSKNKSSNMTESQNQALESGLDQLTVLGATGQSFFMANLIYIVLAFFLSFYVFQRADPTVSYIAGEAGASLFVAWLATGEGKAKEKKQ
eukprot:gb/GECH01011171.1/.p1 GENE.gb/GECH01011171.1/~~gb/GECH01011171.1/.p1  ORF type:complete len:171 (+),score=18.18 gb/GECH01011171.1/:1-513(+)